MLSHKKNLLLALLVFSQFAGTSLWFAGNIMVKAIAGESATSTIAHLSSMVQAGFISGTLVFALLMLPDRFRASSIFFACSFLGAITNILVLFYFTDLDTVAVFRFSTGFFLAGIYPVGMKLAAEKFPDKLGNAMGFLVGALVLGTALPHLLYGLVDWKIVLSITSVLAMAGGLVVYILLPSTLNNRINKFQPGAISILFQSKNFRSAAFGYFGHMWELYAFWAFIPLLIQAFETKHSVFINTSSWSFIFIAIGGIGCVVGGRLSRIYGSRKIALVALMISGACCALMPFTMGSLFFFVMIMMIWGFSVVADSPQFSTMVAQSAPVEYKGTALTIVTCIGFAITIVSIQVLKYFLEGNQFMIWILLPGPLFGIFATLKYKESKSLGV
jgi:MFS family permease